MQVADAFFQIIKSERSRISSLVRGFDITMPQFRLLRFVRQHSPVVYSLCASFLGSDRPTITALASTCIAQGYVSRRKNEQDGRSYYLVLTGDGEELLDKIDKCQLGFDTVNGKLLDCLTKVETQILTQLLGRLVFRSRQLTDRMQKHKKNV